MMYFYMFHQSALLIDKVFLTIWSSLLGHNSRHRGMMMQSHVQQDDTISDKELPRCTRECNGTSAILARIFSRYVSHPTTDDTGQDTQSGIKCFAALQQNLKSFTASFFYIITYIKKFQNTITASLIWLTALQHHCRCRRCSVYANTQDRLVVALKQDTEMMPPDIYGLIVHVCLQILISMCIAKDVFILSASWFTPYS